MLGILILLSTEFFAKAFGIILAICLLVYGLFQLNVCINLRKLSKSFMWDLVEALLLVVFAILLLIFSNSAMEIVIIVLGSGMIIVGLYVAVKTIILNKRINSIMENKSKKDDNIVETTVAKEDKTENENNDK